MILQSDLAPQLKALLALNPAARELRIQLKVFKVALEIAEALEQFELVPALEAGIEATEAAQKALDILQKGIIKVANAMIRVDAYRWRRALHGLLPSITTHELQVTPVPKDEKAPEYEVNKDFSNAQAAKATYQLTPTQMFGSPLLELFSRIDRPVSERVFKYECAATLEERSGHYHPRLWQ